MSYDKDALIKAAQAANDNMGAIKFDRVELTDAAYFYDGDLLTMIMSLDSYEQLLAMEER